MNALKVVPYFSQYLILIVIFYILDLDLFKWKNNQLKIINPSSDISILIT